jgi:hypothetical protein
MISWYCCIYTGIVSYCVKAGTGLCGHVWERMLIAWILLLHSKVKTKSVGLSNGTAYVFVYMEHMESLKVPQR